MKVQSGQSNILAAAVLLAAFLAIYLPDMGHGFIADDHRWIRESQIASPADVMRVLRTNVGFYRPLVALTFGLDFRLWGANAFGYAITNLLLALANAALLMALARRLGLPRAAAVFAAGIWLFNFHGVNMALLWLSGRTSLLAGMLGLAAGWAFLDGRRRLAGALALLAMLAKEDAVLLPGLFLAWTWIDHRGGAVRPATLALRTWPAWTALAVYAALRAGSGAFGVADAPVYYRLTFDPAVVARNALEYLDRGATLAAGGAVVLVIAARRVAPLDTAERRAAMFGAIWFLTWNPITVFLPIRSSLYALVPSLGAALAAGALAAATRRLAPRRFAAACAVLVAIAIAALPIYRSRNVRWVAPAELSARALATIRHAASPSGVGTIVVVDDPAVRFNLETAFGALFPDAVGLWIGPGWTGQLTREPLPPSSDEPGRERHLFRLRGADIEPIATRPPA